MDEPASNFAFEFNLRRYSVARILKFMNFQPRIGLVTRTLYVAAADLLHFFLLAGRG